VWASRRGAPVKHIYINNKNTPVDKLYTIKKLRSSAFNGAINQKQPKVTFLAAKGNTEDLAAAEESS